MTSAAQCIKAAPLTDNPAIAHVQGDHLDVRLYHFAVGEVVAMTQGVLFEEVAAVVEGVFHVDAAGEAYDLVVGEGIIIPRGEKRVWTCTEGPGVLYRVHDLIGKPA